MIDARLTIRAGSATKQVQLADYLEPSADEAAHEAEYRWIKSLRNLPVDGAPFRGRFTARGDSLWWFTELYLHKTQVVLDVHRAIAAVDALFDREAPSEVTAVAGSPVVMHVVTQRAAARGGRPRGPSAARWLNRLATLDARARMLTLTALASRERWSAPKPPDARATIAAFVHRAFWRSGAADGSAESYIGTILSELETRPGAAPVRYVGVGPASNFRAHRRLAPARTPESSPVVPIERFAGRSALGASRAAWRGRYVNFRTMTRAASLRDAARIAGIDCWPVIREQLAGVAWLQWPWSVRAMDESAAAIRALRPRVVVTYAEAGGWGRALVLEARRHGIPSAGLQHGFIYRHWLNYRHERDELESTGTPAFPHPTRTLLFDDHAARHLGEAGHLPAESLVVTGSPRLDELAVEIARLDADEVRRVRSMLNVREGERLALVTTKEKEARATLPRLLDAAARVRDVVVAIKPHPAETAETYSPYLRNGHGVRVVSPETPLAPLLAAADVVITVNSTVALDAGALDIPALAIGLPNNLTPFVEAGAIAGTADPAGIAPLLEGILYDGRFRQQLAARRRAVFGQPVTAREPRAAARSADAVLDLIQPDRAGAEAG
jgi:hypothetical protein